MPVQQRVPNISGSRVFDVVYLGLFQTAVGLSYLHIVKAGRRFEMYGGEDGAQAELYRLEKDRYVKQLVAEVQKYVREREFHAILQPPSSRSDLIDPYFVALQAAFPSAINISGHISNPTGHRAAQLQAGETMGGKLVLDPEGLPDCLECVLFVDDVYATGATASEVLALLEPHGTTQLVVASPLKIT